MPLYFGGSNLIRISHKPSIPYKHIAGFGWLGLCFNYNNVVVLTGSGHRVLSLRCKTEQENTGAKFILVHQFY